MNYLPPFIEIAGKNKEDLEFPDPITFGRLIKFLEDRYGQKFSENVWDSTQEDGYSDQLNIIVNARTYRPDDFLELIVKDESKIWFAHHFYGG